MPPSCPSCQDLGWTDVPGYHNAVKLESISNSTSSFLALEKSGISGSITNFEMMDVNINAWRTYLQLWNSRLLLKVHKL